MARHALTDEQWELIEPLIPRSKAKTGRPSRDRRLMLDASLRVLSTGAAWRDLPERFCPWQTIYDHFNRWRKGGVFVRVLEALQVRLDKDGLIDWDLCCLDGASIRSSRAAAGPRKNLRVHKGEPRDHALGRSRGGFGSKFHLVTDGQGTPLTVEVTAGQTLESTRLESVVGRYIGRRRRAGR